MDIPIYGVELSLNVGFETAGMDFFKKITVPVEAILFQKEACINIAEKIVPEEYRKIAWIDHDIFFEESDWYDRTSNLLEEYKLVQMYSECVRTNEAGRPYRSSPSFMRTLQNFDENRHLGSRGGAWAARRELWKYGGLYPYCFLGGGDSMFVHAIFDTPMDDRLRSLTNMQMHENEKIYNDWKYCIKSYIHSNEVSYLPTKIYHEWHGNMQERQYKTRYDAFKEITLSKMTIDKDGVLIVDDSADIHKSKILEYFKSRNEDS